MKISNAAFIAFIASVLGMMLSLWSGTQRIIAMEATTPSLWIALLLIVGGVFDTIMPLFYFALYRNEIPLRIPRQFRPLALGAAIASAIIAVQGLIGWKIFFRRTSVFEESGVPWSVGQASSAVGLFSILASIVLLIAFYRQADDEPEAPVLMSKLLIVVTRVTVLAWGLVVAFNLVRLLTTPYLYAQMRDYALQLRRTPPSFVYLITTIARQVLAQACLFVAPYIIWRCSRPQPPQNPPLEPVESKSPGE
jgi:hypothetical protein